MTAPDEGRKVIATNRKALFNYEIFERAEAGVVLAGSEVKSIREGGLNFRDSFVEFKGGELFLVGARIGLLHDAAEVARGGVPTVMVFVQSLRGLSHTKLEDTTPEHLELSVQALDRLTAKTIDRLASS